MTNFTNPFCIRDAVTKKNLFCVSADSSAIGLNDIVVSGNTIENGTEGININNPGFEGDGVDVNGTIFDVGLRVNDIGGDFPAEFVIHRHSTTLPAAMLGTRSNSSDATHAAVTSGMQLFRMLGGGWTGDHYDLFGEVRIGADTDGAINASSAPGRLQLCTTPEGGNSPVVVMTLDNVKNTTFAGPMTLTEQAGTPSDPASGTECKMYLKDDKFVLQFNDAGAVRYKYLDLTGSAATWVYSSAAV